MNMIKLATGLVLPPSAVTDTFAFFGTRGTGKTYGAGRTVEGFYDAGAQFVWVDPVGVAYGLRIAADGNGLGLDVPVFGGIHGDVPLEATGGELVARVVVEQRASVVLDVSMMTLGEQHRFVKTFATALFNLKKSDRSPVMVVFDEAHEYLPQNPLGAEAEMLHAVRRLWKMGRNFGIGCALISPRPAEVNKGVVNLTERMFCGRLKGPQDRKAMEGWAAATDADASALDKLPTLAKGELLTWTDKGVEAIRFFPKRTFDASKTPEAGDARPTGQLPRIDLDAVRSAMAATIEESKANDPKALRARVADLERQLDHQAAPVPAEPPDYSEVNAAWQERLSAKDAEIQRLLSASHARAKAMGEAADAVSRLAYLHTTATLGTLPQEATGTAPVPPQSALAPTFRPPPPLRAVPVPKVQPRANGAATVHAGDRSEMEARVRRVLTVLAQFGGAVSRRKLGAVAGYPPSGSSMRKALAVCRAESWVDDVGDKHSITTAGRKALGRFEPLPTGPALREYWRANLPDQRSAAVFAILVGAGGRPVPRDNIAAATGYPADGSSMRKALATLRSHEIMVDHGDGAISAAPELF